MTSVAWQQGQVTSSSDFSAPSAFSSQGAGEAALVELLLQLERRAVGQRRGQPEIRDLHAMEVEALAEAGDEGVERRLKAAAGGNRRRASRGSYVFSQISTFVQSRRLVVDGEHVAVELAAARPAASRHAGDERRRRDAREQMSDQRVAAPRTIIA